MRSERAPLCSLPEMAASRNLTARRKPAFRRPTERLSRPEILRLIAACGGSPSGRRNACLIAFAYRGGFRAAELCGLELDDLDRSRSAERGLLYVHVRPEIAKRGRERTVAIDVGVLPYLDAWLDARRALGIRSKVLFCTIAAPNRGGILSTRYLRQLLPRLARRASIARRVHPHALRAAMATEMANEGIPLPTLQEQLGHSSLMTTFLYVKKVAPELALAPIAGRPGWTEPT
jgi:integrase/recombinase XerC